MPPRLEPGSMVQPTQVSSKSFSRPKHPSIMTMRVAAEVWTMSTLALQLPISLLVSLHSNQANHLQIQTLQTVDATSRLKTQG